MTCPYETWISAFMDGELTPQRADAMADHLAGCHGCKAKYEALTGLDQLLQSLPELKPSEQFERTFWKKVADWEENRSRRRLADWFKRGWRTVLAGSLALFILVFVSVFQGRFTRSLSPEEIILAEQMDVLQQYELINNLEILENWEAIAGEDESS